MTTSPHTTNTANGSATSEMSSESHQKRYGRKLSDLRKQLADAQEEIRLLKRELRMMEKDKPTWEEFKLSIADEVKTAWHRSRHKEAAIDVVGTAIHHPTMAAEGGGE